MSSELNEARKRLHHVRAELALEIDKLGDAIGKHNKWGLTGFDAVVCYLVNKHNWLPKDVRSMSIDDLEIALHNERSQHQKKGAAFKI